MSKEFTKNELATLIENWDGKGTISFRQVRVHSCGAKQMCLHDRDTNEMLGHHFAPIAASETCGTFKLLTDEAAAAKAIEVAARNIESTIARYESILESGYGSDSFGYQDGIREDRDELKACTPSTFNRGNEDEVDAQMEIHKANRKARGFTS